MSENVLPELNENGRSSSCLYSVSETSNLRLGICFVNVEFSLSGTSPKIFFSQVSSKNF